LRSCDADGEQAHVAFGDRRVEVVEQHGDGFIDDLASPSGCQTTGSTKTP